MKRISGLHKSDAIFISSKEPVLSMSNYRKSVLIKISKKNEKLHSQFVGVPLNCPMENHFRFINCLETTLKNNDFAKGKISFKSEINKTR